MKIAVASLKEKTTCDRQVAVVDLTKGKNERTMKIGFNKQTDKKEACKKDQIIDQLGRRVR